VRSETTDPTRYYDALHAIAHGRTRTGDIASLVTQDPSNTSKVLARLRELRLVGFEEPLAASTQARRGIWTITDPYFRFWFRYVLPNRSRLARGLIDEVAAELEGRLSEHMGQVWEGICREWVGRHSGRPEGTEADRIGRFWSRTHETEIDVVAISGGRRPRYTLLGACKWTNQTAGGAVLDQLIRQRDLLGSPARRATLAVFSRSGFSEGLEARAAKEGHLLVTPADVF